MNETKIFGIRHIATGEFFSVNGHVAFANAGNAKRSWNRYLGVSSDSKMFFENQTEYELVELVEIYSVYEGLTQ